jgi:RNA polymerase sigma-70 factor, ECF subfamily
MLGDRWEAEDATQEATTRAWRRLRQLRPGMPVRPWFLAIVINQCRDVRRTRWFNTARLADAFQRSRPDHADIERVDVARALARLSNKDRQALFLHFYLDLPVEEVAAALGISPSAAKGRIYRACHRLRPDLQEDQSMDEIRRAVNEAFDKAQAELGDLGGVRERMLQEAYAARNTRSENRMQLAAGIAAILIAARNACLRPGRVSTDSRRPAAQGSRWSGQGRTGFASGRPGRSPEVVASRLDLPTPTLPIPRLCRWSTCT